MAEASTENRATRPQYRNRNKNRRNPRQDNYVPSGDPSLLSQKIEEIGLKDQTADILKKGNVNTVGELLRYRQRELYRIQNFNKKALFEVVGKINSLNLNFRPDDREEDKKKAEPKVIDSRENRIRVLRSGKIDDRVRSKPQRVQREDRTRQNIKEQESRSAYECSAITGRKSGYKIKPYREEKLPQDALIKFAKDNKYGFKDIKGNVVIPAVYEEAFNFKEGLACVEKSGLFGFIDRKNNIVIPIKYDLAMSFSEGLACVSVNEKSGYIDKQGNIVINLIYEAATAFSEGTARVKTEGKWGIIKPDGKVKMI